MNVDSRVSMIWWIVMIWIISIVRIDSIKIVEWVNIEKMRIVSMVMSSSDDQSNG